MPDSPTILVFDSGLGGLTVHAALREALPDARFVYVADDAAFPYGRLAPDVLNARVIAVMDEAIVRFKPDLIVIACNTASTVCLPALRARFALPFVGTVPAVKPAAVISRSKMISVLGTPGTVSREYTRDLVKDHAADCHVTLVGAEHLATLAENYLRGESATDEAVLAEIRSCFQEQDGHRTDVIALACTHYPLLLDVYQRLAPWPVTWVDPAPAIAQRVKNLLVDTKPKNGRASDPAHTPQTSLAFFTSGEPIPQVLSSALEKRGLCTTLGLLLGFEALSG